MLILPKYFKNVNILNRCTWDIVFPYFAVEGLDTF